jgi:acetyltransferase-like isoleucine patch superfamily enzyme
VRLGRNVLVSAGVVLLRGAEVGPNSVIAANSVVREGVYPGGALIGGAPAKTLKLLGKTE